METKRIHAKEYAEKLYKGQKQFVHIAIQAFRAGENNAIWVMNKEIKTNKHNLIKNRTNK